MWCKNGCVTEFWRTRHRPLKASLNRKERESVRVKKNFFNYQASPAENTWISQWNCSFFVWLTGFKSYIKNRTHQTCRRSTGISTRTIFILSLHIITLQSNYLSWLFLSFLHMRYSNAVFSFPQLIISIENKSDLPREPRTLVSFWTRTSFTPYEHSQDWTSADQCKTWSKMQPEIKVQVERDHFHS